MAGEGRSDRSLLAVVAAAVAKSIAAESIALSSSCMLVCSVGCVVAACDMVQAKGESLQKSGDPRFRRFNPTKRVQRISAGNYITRISRADSCLSTQQWFRVYCSVRVRVGDCRREKGRVG